jgi:hypothetical protein
MPAQSKREFAQASAATMTFTLSRILRCLHAALFALGSFASAATCDCCERGPCPDGCRMRSVGASDCCSSAQRVADRPPCCCGQSRVVVSVSDGEVICTSPRGCGCLLEAKELPSGQEVRDSDPTGSHTDHVGGFAIVVGIFDSWVAQLSAARVLPEWPPGLIPCRPVRILYGVWRN